MADEGDSIADTGQFRAFVAGADDEPSNRPRGLLIAVVAAVVVVTVVIGLVLTS